MTIEKNQDRINASAGRDTHPPAHQGYSIDYLWYGGQLVSVHGRAIAEVLCTVPQRCARTAGNLKYCKER
jgi:hypothetical protein